MTTSQTTISALAAPNPTALVGPPDIHHGVVNASHTSAVALVYLVSSMPTPWPFYLAGMGLSLLTVLMSFVMARMLDNSGAPRGRPSAPTPAATSASHAAPTTGTALTAGVRRRAGQAAMHLPQGMV